MDREILFEILKEEILNHFDDIIEMEEAEEIADSIAERLIEEQVLENPISND